jgi:DNA-binding CsgD family transcriptional regulator
MGHDLGLTERQTDELTLIMQGLPDPAVSPENLGLTELQTDVLTLIAQGSSKEGICGELGLSEPTLKNHVNAILRALRVNGKRPRDGDVPEALLPVVPPSPTRSPQGKRRRKSHGFLTAESNRSAPDEPADEAGA